MDARAIERHQSSSACCAPIIPGTTTHRGGGKLEGLEPRLAARGNRVAPANLQQLSRSAWLRSGSKRSNWRTHKPLQATKTRYALGLGLSVALVFLGLLAVAQAQQPPRQTDRRDEAKSIRLDDKPEKSLRQWITEDAAGTFTAALAVIAAIQAGLFVWQLIYMRGSLNDAKVAAEAAKAAAEAARRQAEVADRTLVATFRPKLFVRRMKLVAPLAEDVPIRMTYLLVNGGGTKATIIRHGVTICIAPANGPPMAHEVPPTSDLKVLYGGESCPFVTSKGDDLWYDAQWAFDDPRGWNINESSSWRLVVRGFVEYADDNGIKRTTGFNRVWNPMISRMVPVGDPDYEYVD